jgi:hypothetical protein
MSPITLAFASLACVAALLPNVARASDPCAVPHARSLVLSGGGAKGAFEAGAAYHFIVHRGCDFAEVAGNSVGAINAALLAQAAAADDPTESLVNLRAAAENLVGEWAAIGELRSMMRTRPLGRIRFALFGLDSVANMEPLREFIVERVSLEALAAGRELRIGLTTFVDGRYREIVVNSHGHAGEHDPHALIFASAVVPVFGRMVPLTTSSWTGAHPVADGGLRHATPVTSYFSACRPAEEPSAGTHCVPLTGVDTPPHPRTEQLFVIVTSPFARRTDVRPVVHAPGDGGNGALEDGREILVRMVDLLVDTMYRDDLDDMLTYNELIEWHAAAASTGAALPAFPLGTYNVAETPRAHSLPYEIVLVAPQREDTDPITIFSLEPATQRRQLFCGCIAANETMTVSFATPDMAGDCTARFLGIGEGRDASFEPFTAGICRDERSAVAAAPAAP